MTPGKTVDLAKGKEEVDDMWTEALRRLFQFKRGPFFEHSVSRPQSRIFLVIKLVLTAVPKPCAPTLLATAA